MRYIVQILEVWIQSVMIEAETLEEARKLAYEEGQGTPIDNSLEYSHTLEDIEYISIQED